MGRPHDRPDAPTRARLAVFDAPGRPFRLEEAALPPLEAGELRVRVRACTLCGSDLHSWSGRRPTPRGAILGHEILGEVEDWVDPIRLGDPDRGPLARGQRVIWCLVAHCGDCEFCRRGLPQKCRRAFKYGHEAWRPGEAPRGGLASHCVLRPGTVVLRVPDELPDLAVAPAGCATATVQAALRRLGGAPAVSGSRALVTGLGMLGLSACALLRAAGAAEVHAVDPDPRRRALAADFGAHHRSTEVEPASFDLAIETAGRRLAVETTLRSLRTGGALALVGAVFPDEPVSFAPEDWVRRHLSVHGVHNYAPEDLVAALRFLGERRDHHPFAALVGGAHSLDEVDAAFRAAEAAEAPRIAVHPSADPEETR